VLASVLGFACARGCARCLRGQVVVVVIGLLAPKWLKQKSHD
jgi:hypothetical protein